MNIYIVLETYRKDNEANIPGVFEERQDAVDFLEAYEGEYELQKMGDIWCNEEMQVTILQRELLS